MSRDLILVRLLAIASLMVVLACGLVIAQEAATEEDKPSEPVGPLAVGEAEAGQVVTVQLESGAEYTDATIVRVDRDKTTGEPRRLRLKLTDGKTRLVGVRAVASITLIKAKSETEDEPKRRKRMTRAERMAAVEEQKRKEYEAERRRRIARQTANGVRAWPPLTRQEQQEAVAQAKQRFKEVASRVTDLELIETKHFLFCTNLPKEYVGKYVDALDRMYEWMQEAYGVDRSAPVWRGKAEVYAFANQDQFNDFERRYFNHNPDGRTAGLCHNNSRRTVCISTYQRESADDFALVLVHETSHGFVHCYRTPARVPSWVNEGMAEVIAAKMVPTSTAVDRSEKRYVDELKQAAQPRLGERFFATTENIPFNRYGGASSMTRFLIETDQEKYVFFIDLLKDGVPWEEALRLAYYAGKDELVASYGKWLGVPNLLP